MNLSLDHDFDPRHGEAVEVAPGVRRLTAPNASPFTFKGTNTYLIGHDALTMIDPGPADAAHIETLMRVVGGARVAHILVTHAHRDHSDAVPRLRSLTGAPVLAALPERRGVVAADGGIRLDDAPVDTFAPDKVLHDGAVIDGHGYRLECVKTPGHASDHLCFALVGSGMLFSGDHVMGWATSVVAPPDGSMTDYVASLDRLLARPERLYLPGHGGEIRDGPSQVRGLRAHRRMREAAILDSLGGGDRTIADIVEGIYPGLDASLIGAASLSVLAHLEHLRERGMVADDGGNAGAARYRLATGEAPPGGG